MFVRPFTFTSPPVETEFTVSADQVDYNIYTAMGSPINPVWARVTINAGVIISASSTSAIALRTGVFPIGSRLTIVNNGMITGAGGNGGDGGFPLNLSQGQTPGFPGLPGGRAVLLEMNTTIENNGTIQGGGGGGGGGTTCTNSIGTRVKGGGGGGGAGRIVGLGGNWVGSAPAATVEAEDGTLTSGGRGGHRVDDFYPEGGTGGDPGQPGQAGHPNATPPCQGDSAGAGAGGAAGKAVDLNSGLYIVTWDPMGTVNGAVA